MPAEDDDDSVSPICQILSDCRQLAMEVEATLAVTQQVFVVASMSAAAQSKTVLEQPSFLAYKTGNCLITISEINNRSTVQLWEVMRVRATNSAINAWNRLGKALLSRRLVHSFEEVNASLLGGQNAPPNVSEYDTDPVKYWQRWAQSSFPTSANAAAIGAMYSALIKKQFPQWGELITPEVATELAAAQIAQESEKPLEERKTEHIAQIEAQRELEQQAKAFSFKDYASELWQQFQIALPMWERIPDEGNDRQIVRMMMEGKSNKEIAASLDGWDEKQVSNRLSELRKQYPFIPRRW